MLYFRLDRSERCNYGLVLKRGKESEIKELYIPAAVYSACVTEERGGQLGTLCQCAVGGAGSEIILMSLYHCRRL